MFRLLFVMILTALIGLGSGYFLWGTRVARLTESLSGLTLEIDTMRARLAAPAAAAPQEGSVKLADELHVISEGIAAIRGELAEQKPLLDKAATPPEPAPAAGNAAELIKLRSELEACNADKLDLQLRSGGAVAPPPPVPVPAPTYRPYVPRQ